MIESLQNKKIKNVIRLSSDNRFRKKSETFVVEGVQENQRALAHHQEPLEFYICTTYYQDELPTKGEINLVNEKVYEKIAYRGTSEGIIGIYKVEENTLENLKLSKNSTLIILEKIEKPGNLGAILRSCEAFGIDAVMITNANVDFYNPNVVRSSVGCFFGMNVMNTTNTDVYTYLLQNEFQILTTFMEEEAIPIMETNLNKKSAFIFGTEHSGLSNFWRDKGKNITIPMVGTIDSLNLSNAVAISCYESVRQKK